MSRNSEEEKEDPMTKKMYFGVCGNGIVYKYNHPANYKGFSKDAGPTAAAGPNNTDQTIFGTGVRIHCFEPSPDGLTKRGNNVSKEVDHVLKKSEGSNFGLKQRGVKGFEPIPTRRKHRMNFWVRFADAE